MAKVAFDLDAPVLLPTHFSAHAVRDMHLLLLGERPTWIVLNDVELRVFGLLSQGKTLREVLASYSEQVVGRLLAKIHQARFYRDDMSGRRRYTPKLTLYVTNRCNLRCVHCYAAAGEPLRSELTTEDWLDAIDQYSGIAEAGEVTISGGEPTLHVGLPRIIQRVVDRGHRCVLFTNGTTNGGKLNWVKLGHIVHVVQLSLDGFDPTTNDQIRGNGTFGRVLRTYETLYQTPVQIRLSVCAMPQNIEALRTGLLPFLKKYDPQKKIGLILSPTVVAGRNAAGTYAFDYPELQEAIGDVLQETWRLGWRFPNTFQRNDHQPRCGIGSSIVIMPDGSYRACTFAPITGSIRNQRIGEWYEATQKELETYNVDSIEMCKECDLRHICLGGCVVKMGRRLLCTSSRPCTQANRMFYYEKLVRESALLFGEPLSPPHNDKKGGDSYGSEEASAYDGSRREEGSGRREEGSPDGRGSGGARL